MDSVSGGAGRSAAELCWDPRMDRAAIEVRITPADAGEYPVGGPPVAGSSLAVVTGRKGGEGA